MTTSNAPAVLNLIGDTPLVEITRFDTGPCKLFLKLESQNPGGSIKDRVAKAMIEAAEAGEKDKAAELLVSTSRQLDKAASKGVIHKNQAANRKSSIMKQAASL